MKQITTKEENALIERFYDNDLSEAELDQFQQRLATHADFAHHTDRFGYANEITRQLYFPDYIRDRNKLKKQLLTPSTNKTVFLKTRHWWRSVAAVLLLGIIAIYWLSPASTTPPVDYENIALRLVKIDALTEGSTDRGQEIDNLLGKIAKNYKSKKYQEVLQKSKKLDLPPTDHINSDIQLIKGVAHYHQNNFVEATHAFQQIIDSKDGQQDAALWWLVTTHLHENHLNNATAKKYLQRIIDNKYATMPQAKNLLKELFERDQ